MLYSIAETTDQPFLTAERVAYMPTVSVIIPTLNEAKKSSLCYSAHSGMGS